ncbi:cerebellin-3 [Procambarus clarkii]|uniref:cerebellin-3 n=1 Tax=Procambarus clarkii TaxID=6728 RepID=UPI001E67723E|nr:cerebellin-1-like [Procambarus clarkii]
MYLKMTITLIWLELGGLLAIGVKPPGDTSFTTPYNGTGPLANVFTNAPKKRITRDVTESHILEPSVVAFSVSKATGKLTAIAHVHFEVVMVNIGDGWDTATSEFLAPVAGSYHFIFTALGERNEDITMSLTKNGVDKATASGWKETFPYVVVSVLLDLKRLDKISVKLQEGSIFEPPSNETVTAFAGYLLSSS